MDGIKISTMASRRCVSRFVDSVLSKSLSARCGDCKNAHYAGIFKGGKLVSTGFIHSRNMWDGKVTGCSCHAEVHAIKNAIKVAKGPRPQSLRSRCSPRF